MNIKDILKQYKEKKAKVKSTHARISAWERILNDPYIELYGYKIYNREIGMPGSNSATSVVEREAFRDEETDELTRELLEEWIKEDRSRIALLEIEVEQIEKSLEGLTPWEKYIIECKYFENMYWCNIELSFNDNFKPKNYIPSETLRNHHESAIIKLESILKPYYIKLPENCPEFAR